MYNRSDTWSGQRQSPWSGQKCNTTLVLEPQMLRDYPSSTYRTSCDTSGHGNQSPVDIIQSTSSPPLPAPPPHYDYTPSSSHYKHSVDCISKFCFPTLPPDGQQLPLSGGWRPFQRSGRKAMPPRVERDQHLDVSIANTTENHAADETRSWTSASGEASHSPTSHARRH